MTSPNIDPILDRLATLDKRLTALEAAAAAPAILPSQTGFREALRGLFGSKKALTALGTVAALTAGKVGLKIDDEMAMALAGIGVTLILGFAAQDVGKEKAKALSQ